MFRAQVDAVPVLQRVSSWRVDHGLLHRATGLGLGFRVEEARQTRFLIALLPMPRSAFQQLRLPARPNTASGVGRSCFS